MKRILLNILAILLVIASAVTVVWGLANRREAADTPYDDNQEIDQSNVLQLDDSNVRVTFYDVVLSPQSETRELIASTQTATESI